MKSKRRHELQTNELADQLGQWIERVRPYTTLTVVMAAGALLILVAWYYLAFNHEKKLAESWRSYMLAGSNPQGDMAEDLSLVADQFSGTQAGLWAALTAADVESDRGMRLMFTDRAAAETALNMAKSHYRDVLEGKQSAQDAMLSSRAHFGLAQVHEAQSELEEARKQYALVVESAGGKGLVEAAQRRIDRLASVATEKWYNWFANQKPAPRNLGTTPAGGSPAGMPRSDLGVLPDGPSADFMQDDTPAAPASDTPATPLAEPAQGTPAAPATDAPGEPVQETPTGPALDPPAEPAKEAPAEQQPPG